MMAEINTSDVVCVQQQVDTTLAEIDKLDSELTDSRKSGGDLLKKHSWSNSNR
jgi:hypothetical protein